MPDDLRDGVSQVAYDEAVVGINSRPQFLHQHLLGLHLLVLLERQVGLARQVLVVVREDEVQLGINLVVQDALRFVALLLQHLIGEV